MHQVKVRIHSQKAPRRVCSRMIAARLFIPIDPPSGSFYFPSGGYTTMARLAAVQKFHFYATPLPIVEVIATNIKPSSTGGAILDPCCGTGEPLQLLGKKLGLTTYGNELHPQRFVLAQSLLDYCVNGAREFLHAA